MKIFNESETLQKTKTESAIDNALKVTSIDILLSESYVHDFIALKYNLKIKLSEKNQ